MSVKLALAELSYLLGTHLCVMGWMKDLGDSCGGDCCAAELPRSCSAEGETRSS